MNELTGSLIRYAKSSCKASIKAMSDHHGQGVSGNSPSTKASKKKKDEIA